MHISEALINNIDKNRICKFLKDLHCEYSEEESGMELNYWISELLVQGKLNVSQINAFFMKELFFGMHRSIDVYKIKGVKKLQDISMWETKIFREFNIQEVPFNNIIQTNVNKDKSESIAAIDYTEDEQGDLEKIRLLFVENTGIFKPTGITYTYSYIPVEIDFKQKILIIKSTNRQKIVEGHKGHELRAKVLKLLVNKMNMEIVAFGICHQEALYNMSKGLLNELLCNIPGYDDISNLNDSINNFVKNISGSIRLINVEKIEGKTIINKGVMDIEAEMNKMLQNLTIADYLFNRDEDSIWETGISSIITCIRFNDSKNVTARLNSENRNKQIFNSKAFMDLRNSLEIVKSVHSLSIAYKKAKGVMRVRFEASSEECLSIKVLSWRNYDQEDFDKMWEMYNQYETKSNTTATSVHKEQVG